MVKVITLKYLDPKEALRLVQESGSNTISYKLGMQY